MRMGAWWDGSPDVGHSIEKREILHRLCLVLGVHEHLVPVVQDNRAMVGMANPAADIHTHVPPHALPAPGDCPWVGGDDATVFVFRHSSRMTPAYVDRLTARAVA